MTNRGRHFLALLSTLVLGLPANAQPQRQNLPTVDDLQVGTYVQIEGRVVRGTFLAAQVEVYAEPRDEETLSAVIEALDPLDKTLTVLGRKVSLSDEVKIRDADKAPFLFEDIKVGHMAKAKGTRTERGVLVARRLRVWEPAPDENEEVKITAMIEEADPAKSTFVVFGMKVKLSPRTEFKIGT